MKITVILILALSLLLGLCACGCYESYTARFASGIAEDIAAEYVQLLKELK